MKLGFVIGSVWNGRQHDALEGCKLLVVRYVDVHMRLTGEYAVSVDTVDAGAGDWVLTVGGSSARLAQGAHRAATDQTIVGIVDRIDYPHQDSESRP